MNILLIGAGGREHALAWAISKSPHSDQLFIAPGNAGIYSLAQKAEIDVLDFEAVARFCSEKAVELVVVGPEQPLVDGLTDFLNACSINVFGPSKQAAQLEGSKAFTKQLCAQNNIPTAAYAHFDAEQTALDYCQQQGAPLVIKADGLAAGKGVTVAQTLQEAQRAVKECFKGAFGAAGARVVIEEKLVGEEASFFVLCDGDNILPLTTAQDHKAVFDGDKGPNTGGMGAYSPAPVMSDDLVQRTINEIIKPTVTGMNAKGMPFKGVLYAGLMITDQGPTLIEYNVRFGDPECQVLMLRLQSDIVELMLATITGRLAETKVMWSNDTALTVVMAARGYPMSYQKGTPINLPDVDAHQGVIFHAGTKIQAAQLVANGGRVLNVTAQGSTITKAQENAYKIVDKVDWPDGFNRTDIGWRAVAREH